MPPLNATDFLTVTDPGKQLVDPSQFYQAMQMLLGFQQPTAAPNAQAPGPLLTAAVNTMTSPPGPGPWNVQMPVALGGLRLVLINLCSGPLNLNPSYNMATGRNDQITGISPMPTGNVYSAIAYRPGFWYVASVVTGLPPGDEPVIVDPPVDEPPPETEC